MREGTLEQLRCPRCHRERTLVLTVTERTAAEVRAGSVECRHCGRRSSVVRGVVDLLEDPPDFVVREAAGLGRFADVMRADGWGRDRVLALPNDPSPYWHGQRVSFDALNRRVDPRPGQRLLDVGSNTCWAAAAFARQGLDVVALDITRHELQGLDTAQWWMERDGTYFERVLGVMFDMPLASGSIDHVFCCEVLHHNTLRNLARTFREAFRVLRPGGTLTVARETLRTPLSPQLRPGHEVAQFEGNEHAFLASTYLLAARAAGFAVQLEDPAGHWALGGAPFMLHESTSARASFKLAALNAVRRTPALRRLHRAWVYGVTGETALSFIGRKPASG